jgi:TRAP-type mannitol/chloroaromatic compound transport system permease small subunit
MWIVIPTVAVGFVNVVLRYIGRATETRLTTNAIIELQWYMYSLIFLLGFPYILKHQINVRVDFWFAHQKAKLKAWIDFGGNWIALVPFALVGMYVSFPQAINSWVRWEQSPDADGLPRGPIKMMLAISFLLLFIQALAEQIKVYAVITDRGHLIELEGTHKQPVRIE